MQRISLQQLCRTLQRMLRSGLYSKLVYKVIGETLLQLVVSGEHDLVLWPEVISLLITNTTLYSMKYLPQLLNVLPNTSPVFWLYTNCLYRAILIRVIFHQLVCIIFHCHASTAANTARHATKRRCAACRSSPTLKPSPASLSISYYQTEVICEELCET